MKLAVRYGATSVNPVREVDAIEAKPKNPPRALTAKELSLLRTSLAADERAIQADLPDLVTFMVGTGVRIGEALAVLWSQVDLEAGTVSPTPSPASLAKTSSAWPPRHEPASASSACPAGQFPCSVPGTPPASVSTIRSSAYLLTRDHALAEDLVQTALAKA